MVRMTAPARKVPTWWPEIAAPQVVHRLAHLWVGVALLLGEGGLALLGGEGVGWGVGLVVLWLGEVLLHRRSP